MGFSGLGKFKQEQDSGSGEKVFFKIGASESVRIRPLVELDSEKDGEPVANFVTEFVNPVKFWLSVVEDAEERAAGRSLGRELIKRFGWYKQQNPDLSKGQHNDRTKNWNPKQRFYLPVVVNRRDGSDLTVEVLQLTYGPRSYSQAFVDFHESGKRISDRWWDWSRNSEAKDMTKVEYKLVPDDKSDFDTSGFPLPDYNDAPYVNHVPYEDQAAFLQIAATYPDGLAQQQSAPEPAFESAGPPAAADNSPW